MVQNEIKMVKNLKTAAKVLKRKVHSLFCASNAEEVCHIKRTLKVCYSASTLTMTTFLITYTNWDVPILWLCTCIATVPGSGG